jgi:hemerythrin-like domain-containing protein
MNRLLKQLIKDHQQIDEIIDELARELVYLQQGCDIDTDLTVILAGLEYIRNYPEIYHHPLEDKLMAGLLAKDVGDGLKRCLNNLLSQHVMLEQQTELLEQNFFDLANGRALDNDALCSRFKAYCDLQREHLQIENEVFLPAIEHWLTAKDFAEIRQQYSLEIADKDDSFDSRKNYEQLQKSVVNHSWLGPESL